MVDSRVWVNFTTSRAATRYEVVRTSINEPNIIMVSTVRARAGTSTVLVRMDYEYRTVRTGHSTGTQQTTVPATVLVHCTVFVQYFITGISELYQSIVQYSTCTSPPACTTRIPAALGRPEPRARGLLSESASIGSAGLYRMYRQRVHPVPVEAARVMTIRLLLQITDLPKGLPPA